MSWTYRLIHHDKSAPEDYYAIHEVYCDDDKDINIKWWTPDPTTFESNFKNNILKQIKRMLKDIKKYSVLKISELENICKE